MATSMLKQKIYIPERFRKVVLIHLAKNYWVPEYAPLILGIHGPSGEGKTFQCEMILKEIDCLIYRISGGQLENREAGEPARLIRETYIRAGVESAEQQRPAVVLINDVDTGIGKWGELVQYTVNRQTVIGELMHIADYPTTVEGQRTIRVPFIMTGNDFTKLYGPLVRAGRIASFVWKPTTEEKALIISRIFPYFSHQEIIYLIKRLSEFAGKDLPVAFYSHLRHTLIEEYLWRQIQRIDIESLGRMLVAHRLRVAVPVFSLENLILHGEEILEKGTLANYLS